MNLSNLHAAEGSKKRDDFRRGRGHGSGNGKTAGKGHKGQKARSGGGVRPGFEGGQMPLYRRIPKRGFHNRNAKNILTIDIDELNRFGSGSVITVETLQEENIICIPKRGVDGVKILAKGKLQKENLTVRVTAFSEGAKEQIEALGGKAEVI